MQVFLSKDFSLTLNIWTLISILKLTPKISLLSKLLSRIFIKMNKRLCSFLMLELEWTIILIGIMMRLKHQRFLFRVPNIQINLMEILLGRYGLEQQFSQILWIQKQPNFGVKDSHISIKNLSLTEYGLIWMKSPHYAKIIQENVQLILQSQLNWVKAKTGAQFSILKLQTQSLFKIKQYLLMLSTLALSKMKIVLSIMFIPYTE